MSMTKKEQAEVEALRVRLALRWTEPVNADVPPPLKYGEPNTRGWRAHTWNDGFRVDAAESSFGTHRITSHVSEGYSAWSQQSIPLHSTRERALRAARHEMEKRFAEALRRIDVEIENEARKEAGNG